jgi:hypothetical protein
MSIAMELRRRPFRGIVRSFTMPPARLGPRPFGQPHGLNLSTLSARGCCHHRMHVADRKVLMHDASVTKLGDWTPGSHCIGVAINDDASRRRRTSRARRDVPQIFQHYCIDTNARSCYNSFINASFRVSQQSGPAGVSRTDRARHPMRNHRMTTPEFDASTSSPRRGSPAAESACVQSPPLGGRTALPPTEFHASLADVTNEEHQNMPDLVHADDFNAHVVVRFLRENGIDACVDESTRRLSFQGRRSRARVARALRLCLPARIDQLCDRGRLLVH